MITVVLQNVLHYLLSAIPALHLQMKRGYTALHLAAEKGHDACMASLLMKGMYMYVHINDTACF